MYRIIQLVALAVLFFCSTFVCSAETSKDIKKNKDPDTQYVGKARNANWEIVVTSARGHSGKMDEYIDSAAFGEKPRITIKSTDIIGGQLGEGKLRSEDLYRLIVTVRIKNLQKKESQFFIDDIYLDYEGNSEKIQTNIFAMGDETASPSRVPIAKMGAPSTFNFPLFTKNNIEFALSPEIEQIFRFYFIVPDKVSYFFFHFKKLNPIKIPRPTIFGSVQEKKTK